MKLIPGRLYKLGVGARWCRYVGPLDPNQPVICTATHLSNTVWNCRTSLRERMRAWWGWKVGRGDPSPMEQLADRVAALEDDSHG